MFMGFYRWGSQWELIFLNYELYQKKEIGFLFIRVDDEIFFFLI